MSALNPILKAESFDPGVLTLCSRRMGWRSLVLRGYDEADAADEVTLPPAPDQVLTRVTRGGCEIESFGRGAWRGARYRAGSLGMTPAGKVDTLRWRRGSPHSILKLHLPGQTLRAAGEALTGRDADRITMPDVLAAQDPLIEQVLLSLQRAVLSGVPDLYAAVAADLLAMHLLVRHSGLAGTWSEAGREDASLKRVDAYMRDNLGADVSLEEFSATAGMSRFRLIRLFKATYGETPFQRLMRLRIEAAQLLLLSDTASITEIALECGFVSSSYFASAFRRSVGVSPTEYRRRTHSTDRISPKGEPSPSI